MSEDNSKDTKPFQGELFDGVRAASEAQSARLKASKSRPLPLELSKEDFTGLRDDFRDLAMARNLPLDLRLVSGTVHVIRTNKLPPRSQTISTISQDEIGAFVDAFAPTKTNSKG